MVPREPYFPRSFRTGGAGGSGVRRAADVTAGGAAGCPGPGQAAPPVTRCAREANLGATPWYR
jgi:hypothetical protein